jgi:hypothetical protein
MMNITSKGQIKRRTALANRKAMPVAPSLIARNTMHRHTRMLIPVVHASKRYNLSIRGFGILFYDLFFNLIPVFVVDCLSQRMGEVG